MSIGGPAADTFVTGGDKSANEGGSPHMQISPSSRNRPMVRFDTTDIETQLFDGTLVDAQLRLQVVDIGANWSSSGSPISAHLMTRGWTEGNGKHTGITGTAQDNGSGAGATWHCAVDADIANNQTDCPTSAWDQETPNSPELYPWNATATTVTVIEAEQLGPVDWDVTPDVQVIIAGASTNHGWILLGIPGEKLGHAQFATKESTSAQGPSLVVSFVPAAR